MYIKILIWENDTVYKKQHWYRPWRQTVSDGEMGWLCAVGNNRKEDFMINSIKFSGEVNEESGTELFFSQ